jgi:hypothetical protein
MMLLKVTELVSKEWGMAVVHAMLFKVTGQMPRSSVLTGDKGSKVKISGLVSK